MLWSASMNKHLLFWFVDHAFVVCVWSRLGCLIPFVRDNTYLVQTKFFRSAQVFFIWDLNYGKNLSSEAVFENINLQKKFNIQVKVAWSKLFFIFDEFLGKKIKAILCYHFWTCSTTSNVNLEWTALAAPWPAKRLLLVN